MSWLLLLAGFAVLVVGGELLVRGASALSARMGISPMVVGLTVVAIGSSLPELAVGVDAAVRGSPGLVTGNIVGTNIVNLLLVLGLAAAIQPIITARQMLRLDLPAVAAAAVLLLVLSLGGSLTWPAGVLLLLVGVAYTATILWYTKRSRAQELSRQAAQVQTVETTDTQDAPPAGWRRGAVDAVLLLGGIVLVILGADWLVTGAVDIASELGVSDALIGLTIVAVGTSAPELVTTVVATLRGQASMAVGNLIGSSVYNIVFILGATVLVAPDAIPVPDEVLRVDMPVLVVVSLLVVLMFRTGRRMSRWEGLLLVAFYAVYLTYLLLARV
ncbi:calcium/sodium antiporter [Corynebacterium sp. AOP12-C2-36]|uniref:calcium/sodium antiporter n=1 Tax=Corynebacterium sp. AOP12-C2-36 TaxID=3457723 RepID=UPI004034BA8B